MVSRTAERSASTAPGASFVKRLMARTGGRSDMLRTIPMPSASGRPTRAFVLSVQPRSAFVSGDSTPSASESPTSTMRDGARFEGEGDGEAGAAGVLVVADALVAAGEVVAGRVVCARACLRDAIFAFGGSRRAREIATCAPVWATTRTRG